MSRGIRATDGGWPGRRRRGRGFAQLTVAGRGRGRRGRRIRTTDGGWPGTRQRVRTIDGGCLGRRWGRGFAELTVAGRDDGAMDGAEGFAQLPVAGRDDGGEGEDSHN